MKKLIAVLLFGCYFINLSAQYVGQDNSNGLKSVDTTSFKGEVEIKLDGKTKFTDYKVFTYLNDTTYIDTTLSLKKYHKINYLRKDYFELLPFHNMGQTFNKLGYSFQNGSIFPLIGANAKQFNYQKVEDIKYYYTPTPSTEIMYRSALEQGQFLETLITMNTSKQFNFSLGYVGLRSLGKYRYALSSHGNFKGTFNYHNIKKTYYLKGHISTFDFYNQENGGLTVASIGYFEASDPNYTDRGRLDTNLQNATNMYEGKRYYTDQSLTIFSKKNYVYRLNNPEIKEEKKDSLKTKKELKKELKSKKDSISTNKTIALDSIQIAELQLKKEFKIQQDSIARTIPISEIDSLKLPMNLVEIDSLKTLAIVAKDSLSIKKPIAKLDSIVKISEEDYTNYDLKLGHRFMYETVHYRFNQSAVTDIFGEAFGTTVVDHTSYQKMNNEVYLQFDSPISGKLRVKGNQFNYNYHYNSVLYYDDSTIKDKLKGNALAVGADWNTTYGKFNLTADANSIIAGDITGNSLKAATKFTIDSVFNFKAYAEITNKTPDFNKLLYQSSYKNYNWQNNFKNETIKLIGAGLTINKWGSLNATFNKIDNYTYFNEESKPVQAGGTLEYFKAKAQIQYTFRKFTIDNTVMYQKILEGEEFFRVPELVTRNSIYFTDYLFPKKPLFLQTGFTFKYFTAFKTNAYNPLLSEFVLQNDVEIGNYPMIDFFANAQIQRTRLYFKVENITANLTGRNYYSAPNYPYLDLTVRFGIVWNFFI